MVGTINTLYQQWKEMATDHFQAEEKINKYIKKFFFVAIYYSRNQWVII